METALGLLALLVVTFLLCALFVAIGTLILGALRWLFRRM